MTDSKKQKPFKIILDQKQYKWDDALITGLQLKNLAGVDPAAYHVWQEITGPGEDLLIEDAQQVNLSDSGVERFFTGRCSTTEG